MKKQNRAPRILMLLENNRAKLDVRVWPHAGALARAGYDVTVICPRKVDDEPWHEIADGVCLYRFPFVGTNAGALSYVLEYVWGTLAVWFLTMWVWIRHGLDILLLYNPPDTLFVAGILPKLAGKTIVFDIRDLTPELYQAKFAESNRFLLNAMIWLERQSCRLADHVSVVNESYRQIAINRGGTPADRTTIIRQAPDLDQVHLVDPDPELRARAKTIFAFLGIMSTQDGIDHLFSALHHLDTQFGHTDWLCVMIGPADDQRALENLAAELEIADRVYFTGYLPTEEWVPVVSTADICVEPCPPNPLNLVSTMNKLMDYMALGKPMVAYDLPEHHVSAGDACLYAEPGDVVDFARQLAKLIESPELHAHMGAVGRERIDQGLSWRYQRERLLNLYRDLTAGTADS